ncbi:shikimate kinase [Cellulomonas marina]|uniref:Shikimate kinase n=1 Tax=Cellulomonas marina TaxID=988821 RepID=A0A1I0W7R3_9CELL|nr:shikimate kinase [Cellulomonas marina]GIG29120.1 hypothetical protein Cma02nite_17200 [Cellulomonas marina]SFA84742.1 shikimate kinase [Cellulomonas marina]
MNRPPLVLVGPPGVPVAAVARAVATRVGRTLVDTDEALVAATGRSVTEQLVEDGEEVLRSRERTVVAPALALDAVVALGSGAVLHPATRAELVATGAGAPVVVHLELDAAASARRAGLNAPGAVALGATRARWRALHAERTAVLADVADLGVDASAEDPEVVAEAVLAALARWATTPPSAAGPQDGVL